MLIASRAAVGAGVDLQEVTDLVLYDNPESGAALKQILGRFDRIGRVSQLKVHILTATGRSSFET